MGGVCNTLTDGYFSLRCLFIDLDLDLGLDLGLDIDLELELELDIVPPLAYGFFLRPNKKLCYIFSIACVVVGLLWFVWGARALRNLQEIDVSSNSICF